MRDIIFTIVFVGLLPVSLIRPWIGILVWSWIGFMNPHMLTWGFARNLPVAFLVGCAVLAGSFFARDRKSIPLRIEVVLLLFLSAYFTLTTCYAMVPQKAWDELDKLLKIVLMALVTTMFIHGKLRIRALLLVIALSIGFYGVKGGIFTLSTGGVYRVQGPMHSFIGGNTELGLAFLMIIPLLVFLAREEPRKWLRQVLYLTAILSTLSTIFTYSRGALVGLAVVLPLLIMRSRRKILVIALLIPAGYFLADFTPESLYKRAQTIQTYQEDASAMLRLQAWSVSWNLALKRPFTGGGFNIDYLPNRVWMEYADRKYDEWGTIARTSHSIYFQVLGEHGFVALGIFCTLLSWCLITLQWIKREAKSDSSSKWLVSYANAVQIGLLGYMISGTFLSLAYFDLFYTYIALTVILYRELKTCKNHSAAQAVEASTTQNSVNAIGKTALFSLSFQEKTSDGTCRMACQPAPLWSGEPRSHRKR